MDTRHLGTRSTKDRWVLPGAVMGVAAGMIFITFEMTAAAFVGADFFSPLKMTGATVLGHGALESSYSLGVAGLVGLLVHATLSAVYGAAFGVASAVGPLRRNREVLLVAATAFGALLWAVNFYLVIPVAFPWFLAASPMMQLIAHTFFWRRSSGYPMHWEATPASAAIPRGVSSLGT